MSPPPPPNRCFTHMSGMQADYVDHGDHRRGPIKPKERVFTCPFDGQSTYASDFDKKAQQAPHARARNGLLQSHNLANHTTYAGDYVPKPFAAPRRGVCCDHRTHGAVEAHDGGGCEGCGPGCGCGPCSSGHHHY